MSDGMICGAATAGDPAPWRIGRGAATGTTMEEHQQPVAPPSGGIAAIALDRP